MAWANYNGTIGPSGTAAWPANTRYARVRVYLQYANNQAAAAYLEADDIGFAPSLTGGAREPFFVEPNRGWVTNEASANHVLAYHGAGYHAGDGVLTALFGNFYVPPAYAGMGITVEAVVSSSAATGSMYVENTVFYAADGEAYNASNDAAGYSAIACTTQLDVQLLVNSAAAALDFVTCRWARAANSQNDTATGVEVRLLGWRVTYT